MRLTRSLLLSLAFVCLCLLARNQLRLAESRAHLRDAHAQLTALSNSIATAQSDLESLHAETAAQQLSATSARAALVTERREMGKIDPETLWTEPPASLPDWQPESPYVWLPREILPKLPFRPFNDQGQIDPAFASVLALDSAQQAELGRFCRAIYLEYQTLEASHVTVSTNHPVGLGASTSQKHTIEVNFDPAQINQLKEKFTTGLSQRLGEQRSQILLEVARPWLSRHLNNFAPEPRIISIARHTNGTYNIVTKSGDGGYSSIGGPANFDPYIPPHLLHHFDHLRNPPL